MHVFTSMSVCICIRVYIYIYMYICVHRLELATSLASKFESAHSCRAQHKCSSQYRHPQCHYKQYERNRMFGRFQASSLHVQSRCLLNTYGDVWNLSWWYHTLLCVTHWYIIFSSAATLGLWLNMLAWALISLLIAAAVCALTSGFIP